MTEEVILARGRPSKYDKIYCEEIIDLFETGGDIAEFCANVNIGIRTFHHWVKEYDDFRQAYEIADAKAYNYYCKALREQGLSKTNYPNSNQLFTYVRQRWKDKFGNSDSSTSTTNNVTINSIDSKSYLELKQELSKIPNLSDIINAGS